MARRADLDRAKGLAILFVVFGHIVARQDPGSVHWYEPLRRAIYAFHMPFFLYLSGLVLWISGRAHVRLNEWPELARARARRLLLPFMLAGFLIVLGKITAVRYLHVDNVPAGLWGGFADLVWHTARSPALSIWYLFVLFIFSLAAPLVVAWDKGRPGLMVALGAVLYAVAAPAYLYADRLCHYAIFFAFGLAAAAHGDRWLAAIDRWRAWSLTLFLGGFVLIAFYGDSSPHGLITPDFVMLAFGAVSLPALHALVRSPALSSSQVLLLLGRYSLMIYLFNTMFIGLAKGLLLLALSWNGAHFMLFAAVLMASGLAGPVLLKRHGLKFVPVLDRLTD
jgi:fucose 4-O-acetylase-like acetyltransferase